MAGAVLPQHMDLLEQFEVGRGDVQALQRVEDVLEARNGIIAGLGSGNYHETAVDAGLFGAEGAGAGLAGFVVVIGL